MGTETLHARSAYCRVGHHRLVQECPVHRRAGQIHLPQVDASHVGSGQIGSGKVHALHVRAFEDGVS